MRISVTRSGGYAGIEEQIANIDTNELEPAAAAGVERAVADADFFGQPDTVEGDVGADLFRYEVTVEADGRSHTVAFGDGGAGDTPLARLVSAAVAAR